MEIPVYLGEGNRKKIGKVKSYDKQSGQAIIVIDKDWEEFMEKILTEVPVSMSLKMERAEKECKNV